MFVFLLLFLSLVSSSSSFSFPCSEEPLINTDACNTNLPAKVRSESLVSQLKLNEKLLLFSNNWKGVRRFKIASYQWWNEGLHGVANSPGVSWNGPIKCATSFPQPSLTSSSFDRSLFNQIGVAISTEARAMFNCKQAGLTYWTPNLNINRDVRWGRGQETPGEDPFLTSEYVAAYVPGLQNQTEPSGALKVSACCKHFAAYSLENWHGVTRHEFNAIVSERDLSDTYLPAFKACASSSRAAASATMCSYNELNGIPSCANSRLLTDLLRGEWRFDGYVTSDCGAVSDILHTHNYTHTPAETVIAALGSGVDNDCGSFIDSTLPTMPSLPLAAIDRALLNQFRVLIRLGMLDDPSKSAYASLGPDQVNSNAHKELAFRAALESIVLLKNENAALPLQKPGRIAVIGPSANATNLLLGNYYGIPCSLPSPLQAMREEFNSSTIVYEQGCSITGSGTDGFSNALAAASKADVTVFFGGLDQSVESEGKDRVSIAWPGVQAELIEKLARVSNRFILVSLSGGPIDLSAQKENPDIDAILYGGYPGQSGAIAIARILSGAVSPSGRLTTSVFTEDYVNQLSMFDMRMSPTASYPGRTYRYYERALVYPFGYGLSYTQFEFSLSGNAERLTMVVKNIGQVSSGVSALLFLKTPNAGSNGVPKISLVGFSRINNLAPRQSQSVNFVDISLTENHQRVPGEYAFFNEVNGKKLLSINV